MTKTFSRIAMGLLVGLALTGCAVNVEHAPTAATTTTTAPTPSSTPSVSAAAAAGESALSPQDETFDTALSAGASGLGASYYVDTSKMASYRSTGRSVCLQLDDGASVDSLIDSAAEQSNDAEVMMLLMLAAATADGSYCPGYQSAVQTYASANGGD